MPPSAATGLGAGLGGNHKEAGRDGKASLFFLQPTKDAFFLRRTGISVRCEEKWNISATDERKWNPIFASEAFLESKGM